MQPIILLFEKIIDSIFPRKCAGCGKTGSDICVSCLGEIPRARKSEYDFIHARFDYSDYRIRALIKSLKYKNAQRIAGALGQELAQELIEVLGEELMTTSREPFLLIPIPLHPKRMRERGYNQSNLIAKAILANSPKGVFSLVPDGLTRTRNTNIQARKERRAERFKNLAHAFVCKNEDTVRGHNVVIIDDVSTTGATLKDARRALLQAKARTVVAFCIAH